MCTCLICMWRNNISFKKKKFLPRSNTSLPYSSHIVCMRPSPYLGVLHINDLTTRSVNGYALYYTIARPQQEKFSLLWLLFSLSGFSDRVSVFSFYYSSVVSLLLYMTIILGFVVFNGLNDFILSDDGRLFLRLYWSFAYNQCFVSGASKSYCS